MEGRVVREEEHYVGIGRPNSYLTWDRLVSVVIPTFKTKQVG